MPGGLSYGAIGAAYGLVVQLYANGLRRVPALRRMRASLLLKPPVPATCNFGCSPVERRPEPLQPAVGTAPVPFWRFCGHSDV
jgi:hypothetical protein